MLDNLAADPRYQNLVRRRQRASWILTGTMIALYTAFISLIAFDKPFLGQPLGHSTTSVAVVAGVAMLIAPILICAIYVWLANRQFDHRLAELLTDHQA